MSREDGDRKVMNAVEKMLTKNRGKMATRKYRMPCMEKMLTINSECPREDGDWKIQNAAEKMLTRNSECPGKMATGKYRMLWRRC
jgi:hypothetical protein